MVMMMMMSCPACEPRTRGGRKKPGERSRSRLQQSTHRLTSISIGHPPVVTLCFYSRPQTAGWYRTALLSVRTDILPEVRSTDMRLFDALFYYVLGGVTFLPLCVAGIVAYIWYTAEPIEGILDARDAETKRRGRALAQDVGAGTAGRSRTSTAEGEKDVSTALDLAGPNGTDALDKVTKTSAPDVDVPSSARRLGPVNGSDGASSQSQSQGGQQQLKPHRSGWVTVRRHFDPTAPVPTTSSSTPTSAAASTTSLPGTSGSSNAAPTATAASASSSSSTTEREGRTSANDKEEDAASITSTGSTGKRSMMSAMYRGILDYRTQRAEARRQREASAGGKVSNPNLADNAGSGASASSALAEQVNGSQLLHPISSGAAGAQQQAQSAAALGRYQYYCMLKGPILYIYSSDDIKDPNTECYAAIDMRGKRVSIYVSAVGDAQGEPEDELDSGAGGGEDDDSDDEDANRHPPPLPSSTLANAPGVVAGAPAGAAEMDKDTMNRAQVNWRKVQRVSIKDGELFVKRNAVRIVSWNPNAKKAGPGSSSTSLATPAYSQWFVFAKSATQLEDWYHALVHASWLPKKDPAGRSDESSSGTIDPLGAAFSNLDMVALLASLDSIPDPIPLRWLNAVLGRIFFTIYRTEWLENYITSKMMKKIRRVKTPTFLSNLRVREVDVGRSPPAFSRPMLKTLTGDGEASMEVAMHYKGQLRITVSTDLTISIGSRFKPYTVSLLLAVVIRSLEGNLLLMIKPPPSNRLWFAFTAVPKMTIGIEPVVSERKVQWGMVTRLIEGRIKELLSESLVVPNMDDVPFFDTRKLKQRGGVWGSAAKQEPSAKTSQSTTASAAGTNTTNGPARDDIPSPTPTAKAPPVKSAPITPISSPYIPATPAAEEGTDPIADSSSVDASSGGTNSAAALRSRRAPSGRDHYASQEQEGAENLLSLASPGNSSAAIAGLRNTLSRDMAATRSASSQSQPSDTATARSTSRSSQQQQGGGAGSSSSQRRRSWLPIGQGKGSSGVTTLGGAPLSSMALGHASFVREGQQRQEAGSLSGTDTAHSYASDTDGGATGSEAEVEPESSEVGTDAESQGGYDLRGRRRASQTSFSADEDSGAAGGDGVSSAASIPEESDDDGRDGDGENEPESDLIAELGSTDGVQSPGLPSIAVRHFDEEIDRTSTPVGNDRKPVRPRQKEEHDEPGQHEREDETRSAGRHSRDRTISVADELEKTPPLVQREDETPEPPTPTSARPSASVRPATNRTPSVASRSSVRSTDTDSTSEQASAASSLAALKDYSVPLPAQRRPSQQSVSSVSSSEASLSRPVATRREAPPARPHVFEDGRPIYDPHARYGTSPGGPSGTTSTSSAMNSLNASTNMLWNKAKASLADKESRQAAAKDAKDAIKRGWASWNAKRAENRAIANQSAPGMVPQSSGGRTASAGSGTAGFKDYSSSQGPEGSLAVAGEPLTSSSHGSDGGRWFASSPPDPAALGLGIDPSRFTPSATSSSSSGLAEHQSNAASTQSGKAESFRSETGRPAYRDHLANKHRSSSSTAKSVADSPKSSPLTSASGAATADKLSTASPAAGDAGVETPPPLAWDSPVPSLTPPAPAARSETEEGPAAKDAKASAASSSIPMSSPPLSSASLSRAAGVSNKIRRIPSTNSSGSGVGLGKTGTGRGDDSNSGGVGGLSFVPAAPLPTTSLMTSGSASLDEPLTLASLSPPMPAAVEPERLRAARQESRGGTVTTPSILEKPLQEEAPPSSGSGVLAPSSSSSAATSGIESLTAPVRPTATSGPPAATPPLGSTGTKPAGGGGGVRTQPPRAAMMAIPGIPATQKNEPQSFSAPPLEEPVVAAAGGAMSPPLLAASLSALRKTLGGKDGNAATDGQGAPLLIDDDTVPTASQGDGVQTKTTERPAETAAAESDLLGLSEPGQARDQEEAGPVEP